jgi:chemotaxis protein methyltransferase CheR
MNTAITDQEFGKLRDYLLKSCGIDIPMEKRYLFVTRLGDWIEEQGFSGFSDLHTRLTSGGQVWLEKQLIEAMTTNETDFFRDSHPWESLAREILPALAKRRANESRVTPARLRIWSAGCSTGEEPYSMAMTIFDWLAGPADLTAADISILATDISRATIDKAQRGIYTRKELGEDVSPRRRIEYFTEQGGNFVLKDRVRNLVFFAEVNLSRDFRQLGYFDLILCRNVIIYFSLELKRKILDAFADMLNPGGILMLGASESIYQLSDRLHPIHCGPTTYYQADEPDGRGYEL